MSERCDWPKCRQPRACTFLHGTKSWHLCDYHGDLVQDEDDKVLKRARKKIGMPLPEKYPGRMLRTDEDARCSFPECGWPASLVRYRQDGQQAPVCNDHKNREDYEWDGVWHVFIPGCGLDPKPMGEQSVPTSQAGPIDSEPEVEEAPEEDADFSEFEERLASGSYDWDDE